MFPSMHFHQFEVASLRREMRGGGGKEGKERVVMGERRSKARLIEAGFEMEKIKEHDT